MTWLDKQKFILIYMTSYFYMHKSITVQSTASPLPVGSLAASGLKSHLPGPDDPPQTPCRRLLWTAPFTPSVIALISNTGGNALIIKKEKIQSIIKSHKGLKKNFIAILLDIQAAYNYLPPESLRLVASELGIPLVDAIGVATPSALSASPPAANTRAWFAWGRPVMSEADRESWMNSNGGSESLPVKRQRTSVSPWRPSPASVAAPSDPSSSSTRNTTVTPPSGKSERS